VNGRGMRGDIEREREEERREHLERLGVSWMTILQLILKK
jgi:hypothetical protein